MLTIITIKDDYNFIFFINTKFKNKDESLHVHTLMPVCVMAPLEISQYHTQVTHISVITRQIGSR